MPFRKDSEKGSSGKDRSADGGRSPRRRALGAVDAGLSRLFSTPAQIMAPRLLFIASVVVLCVLGLVMVYSASSIMAFNSADYGNDPAYFLKRQGVFMVLGVVACIVAAKIPYTFWEKPAVFIVLWMLTCLLLMATAFGLGVSALGAERSIVVGGFALQPAEFAKITVLLAVGSLVEMARSGRMSARSFYLFCVIAAVVPLVLIYRQPDLGTAIILAVGLLALIMLAGFPLTIVGVIIGLLAVYVVYACITQPYHLQRIVTMFDPFLDPQGDGYQSVQSLYALGSGGVFGTGLGLSRQKFLYLPYAHTDFIFAIIGEELGLVGTVLVVLLFALFIYSGMRIARNAPDLFGGMLGGALTVMIGFQACVNMACVTGIAPVTGKALPFLSYGGSSLIATLMMVGLVLSVSLRSRVGVRYERRRENLVLIQGRRGSDGARSAGAGSGRPGLAAARSGGRKVAALVSFAKEKAKRDGAAREQGSRTRPGRSGTGRSSAREGGAASARPARTGSTRSAGRATQTATRASGRGGSYVTRIDGADGSGKAERTSRRSAAHADRDASRPSRTRSGSSAGRSGGDAARADGDVSHKGRLSYSRANRRPSGKPGGGSGRRR